MNNQRLTSLYTLISGTRGDLTINDAFSKDAGHLLDIWEACFGAREFTLAGFAVKDNGSYCTLTGAIPDLPGMAQGPCECILFAPDSPGAQVEMLLTRAVPDGWKFTDTCLNLPGYHALAPGASGGMKPSFFVDLGLAGGSLLFSSYDFSAGPKITLGGAKTDGVRPGTAFEGTLALSGTLAGIATLAGGANGLPVTGGIPIGNGSPRLTLSAAFPHAVTLGKVTLQSKTIELFSDIDGDSVTAAAGVGMAGSISAGSVTIDLDMTFDPGSGVVTCAAASGGTQLPDLDGLCALVGVDDLDKHLPPQLSALGTLGLESFRIAFTPADMNVLSLSFSVGSKAPWQLLPGMFEVTGLLLAWDIANPFAGDAAQRRVNFEISGSLDFEGVPIDVGAGFPDFSLWGRLAPGSTIDLSVLAKKLPFDAGMMPALRILDLDVSGNVRAKTFNFTIDIADDWPVTVGGVTLALQNVLLSLAYDGSSGNLAGSVAATLSIADTGVTLTAQYNGKGAGWVFTGATSAGRPIPLTTVADRIFTGFKVALPSSFPQISVENLNFSINTGTGDLTLGCAMRDDFSLPLGATSLAVPDVAFTFRRTGGKNALDITGTVKIGATSMKVTLDVPGDGSVSGSITAADDARPLGVTDLVNALLPAGVEIPPEFLAVSLVSGSLTIGNGAFRLELDAPVKVDLGDLAKIDVGKVVVSRSTAQGQTAASFSINGGLAFVKGPVPLNVSGTLAFVKNGNATDISFTAGPGTQPVWIDFPLPPSADGVPGIGLTVDLADLGKDINGWHFKVGGVMRLRNMYAKLAGLLPADLRGNLAVGSKGVVLTIDRAPGVTPLSGDMALLTSFAYDIPPVQVNGATIALGTMLIGIKSVSLDLSSAPSFTVDAAVGLPSELNNIFGVTNGKPNTSVFNTYRKGDPASLVTFTLSAGTGAVTAALTSSLFKGMEVTKDGQGKAWWTLSLGPGGEYGEIRFELPDLAFNAAKGTFSVNSGFEITKTLKIPLSLLKALLKACGLDAAAGALPDGIPVRDIKLLKDNGDLNVDALESMMGSAFPADLRKAIRGIDRITEHLPARLVKYLDFAVPRSLLFAINIGETNMSFDVHVKPGDPPLRLLSAGGMGLQGIELYGISFGTILDGALFSLTVDSVTDLFNPVEVLGSVVLSVAGAAALPKQVAACLPDSRSLQISVTTRKLFMIIEYETEVPVPVPLFCDDIGFDIYDFTGIGLGCHFKFPEPSPDFAEIAQLISGIVRFFTDRNYLLDVKNPPQRADLKLTLGPTYLRLPPYMDDRTLGSTRDIATLSAYELVAHFLNFVKTLNLNELVQALPLDYRVGKESVGLFGISADVSWAITTPKEFVDVAAPKLGIPSGDAAAALAVVPGRPTRDTQGIVMFMNGGLAIGSAAGFRAQYGFALVGTSGFASGFRYTGTLADIVDADVGGSVKLTPAAQPYFELDGHCRLAILGATVLDGELSAGGNGIHVKGLMDLFPGVPGITAKGALEGDISRDAFYLAARGVKLAVGAVTILTGDAEISDKKGAVIAGQFLLSTVSFKAGRDKTGSLALAGSVGVNVDVSADIGPIVIKGVTAVAKMHLLLSAKCTVNAAVSRNGFAAGVHAAFGFMGASFTYDFTVTVAFADVKTLAAHLVKAVEKDLEGFFRKIYGDPLRWLEDLGKGAFKIAGDSAETAGRALSAVYRLGAVDAAKALRSARYAVEDVGTALRSGFTKVAADAAAALKNAGYVAFDAGKAIKRAFTRDINDAAKALKSARYTVEQVGGALKGTFTNDTKAAAKALRDAGYGAAEVGRGIKGTFTNSAKTAAEALKYAGYAPGQIGGVMKDVFSATAGDVAGFFKSAYGYGADQTKALLKGAGYAVSEIDNVIKKIWNWVPHIKIPHIKKW